MSLRRWLGTLLVLVGLTAILLGAMGPPSEDPPADAATPSATTGADDGLPMTPLLGALALICGIGLVIRGRRD